MLLKMCFIRITNQANQYGLYVWMVGLNHFSWIGSELSGLPVIRWSVNSLDALPGGISIPSISPRPQLAGPKEVFEKPLFYT